MQDMSRQIPLDLETAEPFAASRFVTTPALDAVVAEVLSPQAWPGQHACLTGPSGSGKTHLLHMFAQRTGGLYLSAAQTHALDTAVLPGRSVAIDDADRCNEEVLFHLFNRAISDNFHLLLASSRQPLAWAVALPDLQSRVRSVRVLTLPEPDEALLTAILKKLFEQRAIRPKDDALAYLVARMERSVPAAQKIVTELEHYAGGRGFTKVLIRDYLEQSRSLFKDSEF